MKRVAVLIFLLLFLPSVVGWNGQLCSTVKYQKSIEAVAVENSTIYASCSYRAVANSSGLIGIYYLGTTGAYSINGTKLWEVDSGFVVRLVPLKDGVLVGSLGGLLRLNKTGNYTGRFITKYKLYDFTVNGSYIYIASGDMFTKNERKGMLYKLYLSNLTQIWSLNFTDLLDRVRVGKVIYVGSGYPSGFAGKLKFGRLYGVSPEGKILWQVELGEWVRDLEVWKGYAVVGTGYNETGRILLVDYNGNVLWNQTLFYVEDILVNGDTAYVGGYKSVVAVDLKERRIKWELKLPYRVKTLAIYKGKLLAGSGEFKTKNGTVYSVGTLYVIDPKNGKILNEIPAGYVRSISPGNGFIVVGTGSNIFMVFKEDEVIPKSICGSGLLLLLVLLGKKFKKT
ncbi:outer membrane protein assembly factor BamB family protein [Pyrococcus kukulkanii]|uniref:Dehydrogenase n=1 Tax=Pyrococcus kukulkanii TaxID=1609559 RepID=A0A127B8G2_9EURY|nr:PQQ-binding-like beta-propeller repeat protein [Pyrococcus kukulkanii]AMM53672.1 dehydrogenase [Pyrococcus kukulkanii]